MAKLLLFISLLTSTLGFTQTIIYQENFETGNSFTMNSNDLGGASTYNTWLRNNSYTGGSGTFICLGFPFSFTVGNTPSQPSGITSFPTSNYMHITAQAAVTSGINCSSYIPADGTCVANESNFAKMTASISTVGLNNITFDFWWLCAGSSTAFGELYYSLDGGTSWTLKQSNLNNTTNWTQTVITDPVWSNQPSLKFAFRFVNTIATTAADPSFCVDEITIHSSCTPTTSAFAQTACNSFTWSQNNQTYTISGAYNDTITNIAGCDSVITLNLTINNSTVNTISASACDSYTSPSSNYVWTSSGTYMDTIPNTAGCDSVITLNLTINNSTVNTISASACDSYTSPSSNYVWTSSGTFMDTIPNAAGCDSVITVNLIINTVDVSLTNTSPMLTANATGAVYQWLDCSNNYAVINGETAQTFIPTVNGNYAVEVTQNGCTDTSACEAVNNIGVMENSFGSTLTIYPNPTSSDISIDLGANYKDVNLIVRNTLGQDILRKSYTSSSLLQLNISDDAGIYFIEVSSDDKKAILKVVKE